MDIVTVILQKRLIADQIRCEGQFDKLGTQTLSNATTDEAEARVLEHFLSKLLKLVEVALLVIEVDSGGNLRLIHSSISYFHLKSVEGVHIQCRVSKQTLCRIHIL